MKPLVSDKCLGLLQNLAEFYPEASWQRCVVDFYRNVWTGVPTGKVKEVAAMLKAIHAQEDAQAAKEKAHQVVEKLRPLRQYTAANQEWALDFAHDAVAAGRAIRVLSVVDAYTRECLALEVDTSFASRRVTRVLDAIIVQRGMPKSIRCDNGPELTSRHLLAWSIERKIELVHIQPGRPTQNAHIESFHGRLREECLRVSWFQTLFDARRKISFWRHDYNEQRPHSSLDYRTPAAFARAQSYGKAENACGVSSFPTASTAG